MTTKTTNKQIPLIYAYLYMKIKKQMRGNRIAGSSLRKIIQRIVLCDKGKKTKGLPRKYCYDIMKDLINLQLLEKVGKVGNDPTYAENNENVIEVTERLKEWKIEEKLRADKEVNEKLNIALCLLDKDPLYRVMKSQCDKQLKQTFW